MLVRHIPSPLDNASTKVEHCYTGPLTSDLAESMISCNPEGTLMVHTSKQYPTQVGHGYAFVLLLEMTLLCW